MRELLDLIATLEGMREYFNGCIKLEINDGVTITLGDGKNKPVKHHFTISELINYDGALFMLINELWKEDGFEHGKQ